MVELSEIKAPLKVFFYLMLCVLLCHSHLFAEAGSSDASTGYYSVAIQVILLNLNLMPKKYLGLEESFQVKKLQRSVSD